MQPFDLIASENATIPVTVVGKRGIHGVLKLEGQKTRLELLSAKFFHFETDEKGWCDIALLGPKGLRITLHQAVFSGTGQSWGRGRSQMHHASIFPNTIIMDSKGHNSERKVAQISFILEGFNDFFHYQYTEQLNSFDLDDDAKTLLQGLRYSNENKFDSFDLSHIYVCHRPKEVLRFEVGDLSYSVWSSGKGTFLDWHGINLSIDHGATIQFKKPVPIDEALERVYEWRQFFNQMAMAPLPITAISISATNGKRAVEADVYIPYLTEPKPLRAGIYGLHPAFLPLNRWHERGKLADCMESWLTQSEHRRPFRARLDTVLEHMQEGSRQSDISELCSGIDSLSELAKKTKFPDEMIEKMAKAGFESISDPGEVTFDRVKGVLGLLQQRSLKEKISVLASFVMPDKYNEDVQKVVRFAVAMRQDAAHRGVISEKHYPALQPVADALACLCVAYDLGQSGIPLFGEKRSSSNCIGRFFNSVMELNTQQAGSQGK